MKVKQMLMKNVKLKTKMMFMKKIKIAWKFFENSILSININTANPGETNMNTPEPENHQIQT